jgi:hypothetical protein
MTFMKTSSTLSGGEVASVLKVLTRRATNVSRFDRRRATLEHVPKIMFIMGSVAPAHVDAAREKPRNSRSLFEEYENILCLPVSSER